MELLLLEASSSSFFFFLALFEERVLLLDLMDFCLLFLLSRMPLKVGALLLLSHVFFSIILFLVQEFYLIHSELNRSDLKEEQIRYFLDTYDTLFCRL